ncbi:hypothetical protein BSLG_010417 [Batrachochytrium salamandrivorans]|nr:hypothetical protein BSLG_010417 [Batrachochytrium salamandrivorans]
MDPRYANDPAYYSPPPSSLHAGVDPNRPSRTGSEVLPHNHPPSDVRYAVDPRYAKDPVYMEYYAQYHAQGQQQQQQQQQPQQYSIDPRYAQPPSQSQYQPHYQRAVANPGYDHPIDGGVPPQAHPGVSSGFPGSYVHPSGMQQPVVDPRYAQHHGRQTSGSPQYSNDPRD